MVVGDTHGDVDWAEQLTAMAGELAVSTILQVGDFGYWPRVQTRNLRRHADVFLGRIASACKTYGVTEWIVIDGNHDDHQELFALTNQGVDGDGFVRLGERVRYSPRGNRFMLAGARFGTLGGAVSLDAWAEHDGYVDFNGRGYTKDWDWFPMLEAPTIDDVDHLIAGGDLDVLLAHEAPIHVDMSPYYGLQGITLPPEAHARATLVRELVSHAASATRAAVLIHGHWHRRVRTHVDYPDSVCLVEALAANSSKGGRDGRSYLFMELEPPLTEGAVQLRVIDGRDIDTLPS